MLSIEQPPDERNSSELIGRYIAAFIPSPEAGYLYQQPPGVKRPYYPGPGPVTAQLVERALDGERRQTSAGKGRPRVPLSFAVVQRAGEGENAIALAASLDVDHGGAAALGKVLGEAQRLGLWGFAQRSQSYNPDGSPHHDGGHVWIPFAEPQPAAFLLDLAQRLKATAGVKGEAYPTGAKLRPPLMYQLRGPEPRRYPIILQTGERLSPDEPWEALARLFSPEVWQPNTSAQLIAALAALPQLAPERGARARHKSKVNPLNGGSVIAWYNENFTLEELLADAGADTAGIKGGGPSAIRCPFHGDTHPSFLVWKHDKGRGGQLVGTCLAPGCPAYAGEPRPGAPRPFLDAFGLYRAIERLEPAAAVRAISEEYGLGTIKRYTVEGEAPPEPTPDALSDHLALVEKQRERLAAALRGAAGKRSAVTVFDAIMGLGKTHSGAELALEEHAAGRAVAIVAPTKAHAAREWGERLGARGYVWQSKTALCECHDRALLARLGALGYTLPKCAPGCPYEEQGAASAGLIPIFQHNHLHNDGGRRLAAFDLVIIDESPLASLLEARETGQQELRALYNRLYNAPGSPVGSDPALPLLDALVRLGREEKPRRSTLRGAPLIAAIAARLPDGLSFPEALAAARDSRAAAPWQLPPRAALEAGEASAADTLPPVFLSSLLDALEALEARPEHGGSLGWGLVKGRPAWQWYERHELARKCLERLWGPAFLVLDGSANELVNRQLFAPWPVETVRLELPLSPLVTVLQIPIASHTRRAAIDAKSLKRLAAKVATVAQREGLTIDGGVTFAAAREALGEALGGTWLHYGGQRGRNDLAAARCLALVGSPNVPPDALERLTLALFPDGPPLARDGEGEAWEKRGGGDYHALDDRLAAVDRLHGPEEMRQSAHRGRLVTASEAKTVLIFSPWQLGELGLEPTRIVTQLPTTHSREGKAAVEGYAAALTDNGGAYIFSQPQPPDCAGKAIFNMDKGIDGRSLPHVEKPPTCTIQPQGEKRYKPVVKQQGKARPAPAPPPLWEGWQPEPPPPPDVWSEAPGEPWAAAPLAELAPVTTLDGPIRAEAAPSPPPLPSPRSEAPSTPQTALDGGPLLSSLSSPAPELPPAPRPARPPELDRLTSEAAALWEARPFGTRGPLALPYSKLQRASVAGDVAAARAALDAMLAAAVGEGGAARV